MLFKGQPVTLGLVRGLLGTPSIQQLSDAQPAEIFEFLRYLIDPRKAEKRRLSFTMTVEGDKRLWRIQLRNSVPLISNVDGKDKTHIDVSRR